jgi:chemotaxis protein CheY-P-specific phosphatase CheC
MTANFLSVGLIVAQAALASPLAADMRAPDGSAIERVAVDCSAAAAQVVSETGGQLLSASAQTQSGQTVCVITVLVPGSGDERPRKITISVPQ